MLSQTLLQKIADARTTAGGDWIRDGRYTLQVKRILLEDKYKGTSFICELVVVAAAAINPAVAPNAVGTCSSFVYNIEKNESAAGNAKTFLLALLGLPLDTKAEDFIQQMVRVTGPDQPARGMLIRGETYRKPIQRGPNAGKDYVGVNWDHVKQTPEAVAAARRDPPHVIGDGVLTVKQLVDRILTGD